MIIMILAIQDSLYAFILKPTRAGFLCFIASAFWGAAFTLARLLIMMKMCPCGVSTACHDSSTVFHCRSTSFPSHCLVSTLLNSDI